MTKKFIVQVHANAEYAHDFAPEFASIEVSDELAKKIRKMQTAVKKLGVYCMEDFDYTPTFHLVEEFPEDGVPKREELLPWDGKAEIETLRVTDKEFQWTAQVKHTSIMFETEPIDIEELPNDVHRSRR